MGTPDTLQLKVGIKSDPVEYRCSYPWLFRLLAEEGIGEVQLGTFFEIYQLPDEFFLQLRRQAAEFGLVINSLFTAHRELGGFFRAEPGFVEVARRNYERLIRIGALLGARRVGCNPGAVLRDQAGRLEQGNATYLRHMQELLGVARREGIEWLTIEPMSCKAEPPTLPEEIRRYGETLAAWHTRHPDTTARAGFCSDLAHGYADVSGQVVFDHLQLLEPALPWLVELHLKNTDARYDATFGFSAQDRERGIIDVARCRDFLVRHAARLPVTELTGYLEIGGPKLGRDYSDPRLEAVLRESLRHVRETFAGTFAVTDVVRLPEPPVIVSMPPPAAAVQLSPSLMCADFCHLEADIRRLEAVGVELLHLDLMDAHFVPNLPLGLELIRQLRPKTALPFDVHLMVEDNDFFVRELIPIGVQMVSVHAESARHLDRTLGLIREHGIRAGVALNPATPLNVLDYVLDKLDFVMLMTVNPGFAGQQLVPCAIRKIAETRAYLEQHGLDIPIEVDGNVSFANIPGMVAAGASILVAGSSSLFHSAASLPENAKQMRAAITAGLRQRGRPAAPRLPVVNQECPRAA
jgi:ribulose-phosphate 3-epimerase